jgi:hypothetical protein
MDKSEKQKGRCSWLNDTLYTLGLGLGYRTTSLAPVPLHLLPASSHISTQCKVHLSWSGLMRMAMTASNVRQSLSDVFASSLARNANDPGPPLPSHTASNAMRTYLTTMRMTAPCEKFVAGAWLLITCIMIALPLTTGALCVSV